MTLACYAASEENSIGREYQEPEPSYRNQYQRDRDRERAQARTGAKGKQKDDGLTPEQRRERLGCCDLPHILCNLIFFFKLIVCNVDLW